MIRVLQRALALLECFDLEHPVRTLHELSTLSELPKSTAFRVIMTLLDQGYLLQNASGEYTLSPKLMRLAAVSQKTFQIRDVVRPFLVDIAAETGETMDLHVVHGLTRTCIDVVESDQTIKRVIGLGESTPLPRGASGKVLLAFDETGLIEALLEELGPAACKALRKECAEIKRNGYASTHGDRIPGASAIAVPLFEHQRPVRYCMTLAGPSFRIDAREEEFIAIMLKAGRAISERLGAVKAAAEINK